MEFRLSATLGHAAELSDTPQPVFYCCSCHLFLTLVCQSIEGSEKELAGSGSFLNMAEKERTVAVQ